MERLNKLQKQYEATGEGLILPLSLEDDNQLAELRCAIRQRAKVIAKSLNLGPSWYSE